MYVLYQVLVVSPSLKAESIEILLCLPLLSLGQILPTTVSLGQVKHAPQTPVIRGESLCVCDLLQPYQTKVRGIDSGWQGISQVDPVKPASRPKLTKVGLKKKHNRFRFKIFLIPEGLYFSSCPRCIGPPSLLHTSPKHPQFDQEGHHWQRAPHLSD